MFINDADPGADLIVSLPSSLTLLEQIGDCFLAVDQEWCITHVNEAGAAALKRSRADLAGKNLWAEFPGCRESVFGQNYLHAAQTQQPVIFEAAFPSSHRWFTCRTYPSAAGLSIFLREVTEARETRRRLEENEQRYRSLFEQNVDAVFMFDLNGIFLEANRACEVVSGYLPEDLVGMSFLPFVAPEDRLKIWELFGVVRSGAPLCAEITLIHKNGHRFQMNVSGLPVVVEGAVVGVYGIAKDETQRKQMEAALVESEYWMRTIAEASPFALVISRWDDGTIVYTNQRFREFVQLDSEEEALTHFCDEFYVQPSDRAALRDAVASQDSFYQWEGHFRRLDGTRFWSTGAFRRMVYQGETVLFAAYQDTTEQRRLLEQAQDEADRDPLTGLWNHRVFQKRFEENAERALLEGHTLEGHSLAVVVLDLDNFKFFNDAYGHLVGDDVLRQTADYLRGACRSDTVLARFGGDEFALLLPDIEPGLGASALAARLTAELVGISYEPPGYDIAVPVSLSLGVALFPGDAVTRREVMHIADERLRQAKTGSAFGSEAHPLRVALRSNVQGFSMLEALVTAVDAKDRYTRRHSEDVMHYSLQIARALNLDDTVLRTVAVSALLHDVGKIGVPDAILRKPGRLSEEENEAIKLHPNIGAVIVAAVPGLEETLDAVRHHHERWDGQGYPFGLVGVETPLLARLMAVADAYSAMTTDRPYRKGMEPAQALRFLEEGAGVQWDPVCVRAFIQLRRQPGK